MVQEKQYLEIVFKNTALWWRAKKAALKWHVKKITYVEMDIIDMKWPEDYIYRECQEVFYRQWVQERYYLYTLHRREHLYTLQAETNKDSEILRDKTERQIYRAVGAGVRVERENYRARENVKQRYLVRFRRTKRQSMWEKRQRERQRWGERRRKAVTSTTEKYTIHKDARINKLAKRGDRERQGKVQLIDHTVRKTYKVTNREAEIINYETDIHFR